jgi:hypothetical protein
MEDLERALKKVAEEQAKKGILTRRFIVTEGLFEMVGDCSDLPKLVRKPMETGIISSKHIMLTMRPDRTQGEVQVPTCPR